MNKYISKLKLDKIDITTKQFLDQIQYNQFGLSNDDFLNDVKKTHKYKTFGKTYFLYFFSDDIDKCIYIAIIDTPFKFWNKVTNLDELNYIMELYDLQQNSNDYSFKYKIERGYIIEESIPNINIFEKYAYLNQSIISLPWGKEYKPDIFILDDKNPFEIAMYNFMILEENTNEVNFMTKYSRSIISVTCVDNKYFVQLKYKSTTENHSLPQDLVAVLETFPKFIHYRDLLKLDPPMISEALTASSGIPLFLDNIYDDLQVLHKDNKYDNKIKLEINDTLVIMTANKEIFNCTINNVNVDEQYIIKAIVKACNDIGVKISGVDIKNHVKNVLSNVIKAINQH
jgi:hypothetical protein